MFWLHIDESLTKSLSWIIHAPTLHLVLQYGDNSSLGKGHLSPEKYVFNLNRSTRLHKGQIKNEQVVKAHILWFRRSGMCFPPRTWQHPCSQVIWWLRSQPLTGTRHYQGWGGKGLSDDTSLIIQMTERTPVPKKEVWFQHVPQSVWRKRILTLAADDPCPQTQACRTASCPSSWNSTQFHGHSVLWEMQFLGRGGL